MEAAGGVKMRIGDKISTIFVNNSVEIWAAFSRNELILLYFWLFAQRFGDWARPALSKRGIKGGDSPQPAKESY